MLAALALVASMVVPPMTEAELRAAADVVTDATVQSQQTQAIGQRIFTFSVVVTGVGPSARSFVVALPGGVVDGFAQKVPGTPELVVGQRYRLYLGKADGPPLPGTTTKSRGIIGFFRGVFVVDVADRGALIPFGEDGLPTRALVHQ